MIVLKLKNLFFFLQLLTSSAVHKWGTEIHEGIYNMLMLLVDLVAERVKQDPIPVGLLGVLTMVFDSLMQFLIFGYLVFHIYAAAAFSNYI